MDKRTVEDLRKRIDQPWVDKQDLAFVLLQALDRLEDLTPPAMESMNKRFSGIQGLVNAQANKIVNLERSSEANRQRALKENRVFLHERADEFERATIKRLKKLEAAEKAMASALLACSRL